MKRKLKLTITKIYRQTMITPTIFRAASPVCRCEVQTLTPGEAAQILQIDEIALDRLVADGNVHAALTVGGYPRVCKNSLFR